MIDRIKQIMESRGMNQQTFANYINVAPATLNSILTGRTKPSLMIVEAIKKKFPSISYEWLINGSGKMFADDEAGIENSSVPAKDNFGEGMLNFEEQNYVAPSSPTQPTGRISQHNELEETKKNIYIKERRISEIRIFYDDQTWESFVPKK